MRALAAGPLTLAAIVAAGVGGAAAAPIATKSDLSASGAFCSPAPTDVDNRIAGMVNALTVSAPTTPPIVILDTGVTSTTPEIGDRLVSPFDATTGGSDPTDINGHGTQVAGIAAGAPGLMRGVSPTSPIMSVRVFNLSGESTIQWLIAGINWAVMNHAAVINISASTAEDGVSDADVAALTRATSDAFNNGVLVVASVGNDGKEAADIPADLPHVIAVGAANADGSRATFSNFGPWVDLLAPAVSLVAPVPAAFCPSGFAVVNSTPYAAPAVAGAAALLAQLRPELSTEQRFDVLRQSATDQGPSGHDDDTGYGLLNVQSAISFPAPTKQASPEVDDDPFYVRGANAIGHPVLLTRTRKVRLAGQVSAAKDPSDVYRLRLKRGERLTVSANVSGADSLISLGLWKPAVGDFDVSNGITKNQVVATGGFAKDPALKMDAKKTGTYYVSVETPDAIDPDDPTDVAPVSEPYQLSLSKTRAPKKKPAHQRKKSAKKKRKR